MNPFPLVRINVNVVGVVVAVWYGIAGLIR